VRLLVLAAIVAVASVLAVTAQAASARPGNPGAFRWPGGPKPVIVLEHGAWADASSWDKVILRLQEDGFTVYAPPNTLRGLPQDSASLHAFLTQNADQGETLLKLISAQPGSCLGGNPADVFNFVPIPGGGGDVDTYIKPSLVPGHLSLITDPGTVATVIERAAEATG
jgi:hypothetical protein